MFHSTDSRLGAGAVAGIVIVVFILIIIVVCVTVYLIKRSDGEDKTDMEATDMAQVKTKVDADIEPNMVQVGADANADKEPTAVVNQGAEFDTEAAN